MDAHGNDALHRMLFVYSISRAFHGEEYAGKTKCTPIPHDASHMFRSVMFKTHSLP